MNIQKIKKTLDFINIMKRKKIAVLCISLLLAMSMTLVLYSSPTQAEAVTALGNPNVGTLIAQNDANAQSVSYFTCSVTGPITDIMAYVNGASSGNAIAALYSVNGGSASRILKQSNPASIGTTFSWVDFHLPSAYSLTSGKSYGLAIMGNVQVNIVEVSGTGQRDYNAASSYDSGFKYRFGSILGTDYGGAMSIYALSGSIPSPTPSNTPIPTATPAPTEGSVVQNGGFESGISPWILGISDPQSQGYAGTLTQSPDAYSDNYSGLFMVTGNPQGGSGYIDVEQTFLSQIGQTYTLQLYYKGTMTVWAHVFCFDSSWRNLGVFSGPTLTPTDTWTPISMNFLVPSGTANTQIHFDVASTGVFQVDDVSVTDSAPSPSPAPTVTPSATPSPTPTATPTGGSVIQNGDFESGISPWTLAVSDPQSQGYAGTLTRSTNAYSGSYCGLFAVTGNPQGGSGFIDVMQTIPAQVGHTYTLQLYYKGTMTVGPHVFFFDSSWNNLGMSAGSAMLPTSNWAPLTMTFSVPSGTAVTEFHFDVASTGVFQVDSVSVTDSAPSPSPTPIVTPSPSPSPTPKPTATPSPTSSPTPTPTPTLAPTESYTYTIGVSGSNYQLKNSATQQILFQSTNAAQVANAAIGNLTVNQKILFTTGTYTLTSSIEINNKDNGSLVFQPGAKLFVANGMGKSAIFIHDGSDNWVIDGVGIDGNAANQALGGWSPPDGIAVYNHCSNILVEDATINNVRMYGFVAWEDVTNSGIINSKVTNCGWNGIQLGADSNNEQNLYAINNEVAFISDVGITNFGTGNLVQGNYIHDMTGTTGYINSQWGIGVEGGHGHTITGNTLVNCPRAIWIQHTDGVGSNMITNNVITTCGFGIATVSPSNTISNNTISGFDMLGWGQQAIVVDGSYGGADGNNVLNNSISKDSGVAHAVLINSADNTELSFNRIVVPRVGTSWFAVQVSVSSFSLISHNTIVGFLGIIVGDSACQSTTISFNDLTLCNAAPGAIENDGTGTIITGN